MTLLVIIIFGLIVLLAVVFFIALPFMEKSYNKSCEQWKKEQLEKGISEEDVDRALLSNEFIF